jgi:integrase/recombinase XerD
MRSKTSDAGLINLFLDMLAAEQGAGDNTLDAYRHDLEDFSEFLARDKQNFAGVETQALRDYLADLDTRGFKSSSVARRLSAIRHLFRFLLHERIRSDDPAAILSGPKRGRGLPKVLSISDVDRLLVCAKALADAPEASASQRLRALRMYCLLEVLYATGLVAARGIAARRPNDRGPRQGQQGAAGTAERAIATGDGRLSCGDGSAEAGEKEQWPGIQEQLGL